MPRYSVKDEIAQLRYTGKMFIWSWARDNFLASLQRQRNNVIELKLQTKIWNMFKASVSKWSSHNEYLLTLFNKQPFLAWKHGHIVAAVLPRAQFSWLWQ